MTMTPLRACALQVAAMAVDPQAQPVASDDVDAVQWLAVQKLRGLDSKFQALNLTAWQPISLQPKSFCWH
jgi:hypothetical protein